MSNLKELLKGSLFADSIITENFAVELSTTSENCSESCPHTDACPSTSCSEGCPHSSDACPVHTDSCPVHTDSCPIHSDSCPVHSDACPDPGDLLIKFT